MSTLELGGIDLTLTYGELLTRVIPGWLTYYFKGLGVWRCGTKTMGYLEIEVLSSLGHT